MKLYKIHGYIEAMITFNTFNGTNELPYPKIKEIECAIEDDIRDCGLQELDDGYGVSFNCDRIEGELTVDFEVIVKDKDDQDEIDKALEEWRKKYISYEIDDYTFQMMLIEEIDV